MNVRRLTFKEEINSFIFVNKLFFKTKVTDLASLNPNDISEALKIGIVNYDLIRNLTWHYTKDCAISYGIFLSFLIQRLQF